MGGRAFEEVQHRKTAREYFRWLEDWFIPRFTDLYGDNLEFIPAYANKPDFGDADILAYYPPDVWQSIVTGCREALGAEVSSKNGNVLSIGFREPDGLLWQVDLIHTHPDEVEITKTYFSFNDLGNLMGRIAHRMGFKYGHDGLRYVIRDEGNSDHVVAEILVSRDPGAIFRFLGYEHRTFRQHFNDLEDIFKYVVTSPYFSEDIFSLENRNHRSRVRDAKRPTYMKFLKWLEDGNGIKPNQVQYFRDKKAFKAVSLRDAFSRFPEFADRYSAAVLEHSKKKELNELFDGLKLREATGLEGKDLGRLKHEVVKDFAEDLDDDERQLIKSSEEAWSKYVIGKMNSLFRPLG